MTGEGHSARGQHGGALSHPAPFLRKTYDLVDDPSTNHIISWGPQGKSFVVWKPSDFAANLLPQYFKHNNFSSFVRQLNTYGFRKIDSDRWEFANEHFQQYNKDLLLTIHRRKPAPISTAAANDGGNTGAGAPSGSASSTVQSAQHPSGPYYAAAQPADIPSATTAIPASTPASSAPVPIPILATLHSHGSSGLPALAGSTSAPFSLSPPFPLDLGIAATLPLFTSPSPTGSGAMAPGASAGFGITRSLLVGQQQLTLSPGSAFARRPPAGPSSVQSIKAEISPPRTALHMGPLLPSGLEEASAPVTRLEQLVGEFLKPGHQVLVAMSQQPLPPNEATMTDNGGDVRQPAPKLLHPPHSSNSLLSSDTGPLASSTENCDPMAADSEYGSGSATATVAAVAAGVSAGALDSNSGGVSGRAHKAHKRSRCGFEPTGADAPEGATVVEASLLKSASVQQFPPTPMYAVTNSLGAGGNSLTNYDAAGNPLPAGITRPLPQHLSGTTTALLTEMAGQLKHLTALAREVAGLKEENSALKRSMEALTQAYCNVRLHSGIDGRGLLSGPGGVAGGGGGDTVVVDGMMGAGGDMAVYGCDTAAVDKWATSGVGSGSGGSSGSGPIPLEGTRAIAAAAIDATMAAGPIASSVRHVNRVPLSQVVEVQHKKIWDQKLRHDDLEKQLQAQREVSAMQAAKTEALEAAFAANSAKALHDTELLERVLDGRVAMEREVVRDRLEAQERANKAAHDVNLKLEARVVELEAQLRALGQDKGAAAGVGDGGGGTGVCKVDEAHPLPPHHLNNNLNYKTHSKNHSNRQTALVWTDVAVLDARAHIHLSTYATPPLNHGSLEASKEVAEVPGSAAVVAIAAARGGLLPSPAAGTGAAAMMRRRLSPKAELYAKSIEDRLWGDVERIVNTTESPVDSARVTEAHHEATAAPATVAATAALSSSSGEGDSGGGIGMSSSTREGGAAAAGVAEGAAAASDVNYPNTSGSGASDSNTPGGSGRSSSGDVMCGVIATPAVGDGSGYEPAFTFPLQSGDDANGRDAFAITNKVVEWCHELYGDGCSGYRKNSTGGAFSERHAARHWRSMEGTNPAAEGSGSCPPPPFPLLLAALLPPVCSGAGGPSLALTAKPHPTAEDALGDPRGGGSYPKLRQHRNHMSAAAMETAVDLVVAAAVGLHGAEEHTGITPLPSPHYQLQQPPAVARQAHVDEMDEGV